MFKESSIRKPLIFGHKTYTDITNDIVNPIEGPAPKQWKIAFTIADVLIILLCVIGCVNCYALHVTKTCMCNKIKVRLSKMFTVSLMQNIVTMFFLNLYLYLLSAGGVRRISNEGLPHNPSGE